MAQLPENKAKGEFESLLTGINDALNLIDVDKLNITSKRLSEPLEIKAASSLLEKCALVVANNCEVKPTIRLIHHFACSGGTLVAKCLAGLPNIFLLSEMHPFTRLHLGKSAKFFPADVISQARYANFPDSDELAESIFAHNIIAAHKHLQKKGADLLIRVHSHSDYCVGERILRHESVSTLLRPHFAIKELVTLRHPIDSFMSLRDNGWKHFSPFTFDEYCGRLMCFLKQFSPDAVFIYETFTQQPKEELHRMAQALDIRFDPDVTDFYDIFKVSGDSGRSGAVISPRPRKPVCEDLQTEITNSENFKSFLQSPYNINGVYSD